VAEASARSPLSAPESLGEALRAARSGLRRDVERLLAALDGGELVVPLARDLPEAREGERIELDGELKLAPQLLPAADGELFAVLFSDLDHLEPIVRALDWRTDQGPLKVCRFSARTALEIAHALIDETHVVGLVVDPGGEGELCLTRSELGSLLAGRALPLVGYVGGIPGEEVAHTLVADAAAPLGTELERALSNYLDAREEVLGHALARTFNPDRDREPHPTLTLRVTANADRAELTRAVVALCEGKLPPPGYIDILFE
jgi:hypothetical protein